MKEFFEREIARHQKKTRKKNDTKAKERKLQQEVDKLKKQCQSLEQTKAEYETIIERQMQLLRTLSQKKRIIAFKSTQIR